MIIITTTTKTTTGGGIIIQVRDRPRVVANAVAAGGRNINDYLLLLLRSNGRTDTCGAVVGVAIFDAVRACPDSKRSIDRNGSSCDSIQNSSEKNWQNNNALLLIF